MTFGARARIRRGALRHNLRIVRARCPGARVMAMIKANAYGHGLVPVAEALHEADSLAVARLAEVRTLRTAGIERPIVLLGGMLSLRELDEAIALDSEMVVHDEQQIRWLEASSVKLPVAWCKIDTGMRRLGFSPDAAPAALRRLGQCVASLRVMTQFANADDPHDPTSLEQLKRFLDLLDNFDGDISVANSPVILGNSDSLGRLLAGLSARRIWVRPGIALYGISPFGDQCGTDFGLRPAMQFEATLMSVKHIRGGDRVGYGGTWLAEQDTVLGIIAAGYGDGYSRYIPSGTPVLVNGRRAPVAGRISMDLAAVNLGPGATDRVGDPVVLWGDGLPVEEIAGYAGTIPYQLVAGVTHREEPVFDD